MAASTAAAEAKQPSKETRVGRSDGRHRPRWSSWCRSTTRPRTSHACSRTSSAGRSCSRRGGRLIVVDDGSTDATSELVAAIAGSTPLQLVRLDQNQGPGAAFRAGFAAALAGAVEETLVVTLEGDTTSDIDALPAMLERAADGAGLVARRLADGQRRPDPAGPELRSRGGRSPRVGLERSDGLLVLPRLSRFGSPARLRSLRRRLHPRERLRLQGGDPREADGPGNSRRRSGGTARLEPPPRHEQDAGAADDASTTGGC